MDAVTTKSKHDTPDTVRLSRALVHAIRRGSFELIVGLTRHYRLVYLRQPLEECLLR